MDDAAFVELLARVRAGDEAAVRELLARFEDDVQMMVRAQLPRRLRPKFDSMDFVQAVWQSFFSDLDAAPERFANAVHLRRFLAGVVRNKVQEEHRRRTQSRRYNMTREESLYVRRNGRDEPVEVPTPDPSPSQNAQALDRWDQLVAGRSPEEAMVVELRRQGLTYEQIAERTGLSERAARRVIEEIRERMEERGWR
jgi:RNA polymerase sigma-70 factor (ECF subfamily)